MNQTKERTFAILQCLVVIIVIEIPGTYGVDIQAQHKLVKRQNDIQAQHKLVKRQNDIQAQHKLVKRQNDIQAQHKLVKRQINETGPTISTAFDTPTKVITAAETTKDWTQKDANTNTWKVMPSDFSRRKDGLPSLSPTVAAVPHNSTKPAQTMKAEVSNNARVETTQSKAADTIQGTGQPNKSAQFELTEKSMMMKTLQSRETKPTPTTSDRTATKHESERQSIDTIATNKLPNVIPTQNSGTIVPESIMTTETTLNQKINQLTSSRPPGLGADLIQNHHNTVQDNYQDEMEAQLTNSKITHRHVTTTSNTNMFASPTHNGHMFTDSPVDFHATAMNKKDTTLYPQINGQIFHPTNDAQHHPHIVTSPYVEQTYVDSVTATSTNQLAGSSMKSPTTQSQTAENTFNTQARKPQSHISQMVHFENMSEKIEVNKTTILTTQSTTKQTEEIKMSSYVESHTTTPTPQEENNEKPKATSSQPDGVTSAEPRQAEYSLTQSLVTLLPGELPLHSGYQDIKPSLTYGIDGEIPVQKIGSNGLNTSTVVPWADVESITTSFKDTVFLSITESSANFPKTSSIDSIAMEAVETNNLLPTATMSQYVSVSPTMFVFEDNVTTGSESEEKSASLSTSTLHPSQSVSTIKTSKTVMHKSTEKIEKEDIKPTISFKLTSRIQIQTFEKEQIKPTQENTIHVTSSLNIDINATSHNQSSDADQQGETTTSAPTESNMTVSATFGIVAGCLIAFWIIIGPIICLLLKLSDKKKEKNRKLRAEMNRDSKENCIMEAMIMSELGRDVPSMNSSKCNTNENKIEKNSDYLVLAKNRSELENLKNGDDTFEVMIS